MRWSNVQICFAVGLLPFSHLWTIAAILRRKLAARPQRTKDSRYPRAIVVGNIHSGGSGKTPLVVAIVEGIRGKEQSLKLAVVTRGYRSQREKLGGLVDASLEDGPAIFGDEPYLLARRLLVPVFVGSDRLRSLRNAVENLSVSCAVVDDGFQNGNIPNRFDVVAINSEKDPRQSFLLPLGELREPVSALAYAGAIVITRGSFQADWESLVKTEAPSIPVFFAERMLLGVNPSVGFEELSDKKLGFFCGIASPERFFKDADIAAKGVSLKAFADHHSYTDEELRWLVAERKRQGLHGLLTTEKDYWKVEPRLSRLGEPVFYLRIGYDLPSSFFALLEQQLGEVA